ncbi:MAG: serine/threonine-protein kinase [Planctomycetota bacterium]
MPNDHPTDSDHSLRSRLQHLVGTDLDPEISLPVEPSPRRHRSGGDGSDHGAPSSAVLKRLGAHASDTTRYRIDGEVARGGMGAILEVWDEDLRRKLAMKVALDGSRSGTAASADSLDPRVLARFLEEAQVTGQLEHPGIVPVHELGLGGSGEVFFTMRLVRGRDLEQIFRLVDEDREEWTRTRALEVLLKVCDAMAYAHSKGVLHRDLKPANVMVGRFGEVYVMDWGLARVRGHAESRDLRIANAPESLRIDTDRREGASGEASDELYTMDGDVIGTPSYMPPEQARGLLDEIDERADVYSLGAMLYRLLAGVAPYALRNEPRSGIAILNDLLAGPPAPIGESASDVPPELVAIAEKAMARRPQDRYATTQSFAGDLRAFLEHRVVGAYETGAIAEARKWVKRNRPLAAALAAGIVALAVGLVAALVEKGRADDNALLAAERQVEAERQARIAEEVNGFLNDDLFASIAPDEMGFDVTVREVLDSATQRLDGRFEDEPLVEAALRYTLGISYERLGEYETAMTQLDRAIELQRAELPPDDEALLETMRSRALVLHDLGEDVAAYELFTEALERLEERYGPEDHRVLSARSNRALTIQALGNPEEALADYEEIAAIQARVFGEDDVDRLTTLNNISNSLAVLGRYERGIEVAEAALAARRRALGEDHPETILTMSNLGDLFMKASRYEEAEALMRAARDAFGRVYGTQHPRYAQGLSNVGVVLIERGEFTDALVELEKARQVFGATLREDHPRRMLNESNVAVALALLERNTEALEIRERVLELQRTKLGDEHPDVLSSMGNLAMLYRAMGRTDDAEALLRDTLELRRTVSGPDHPDTLVVLENLGGTLYREGDYAGSLEYTGEVLEARMRVLGEAHRDVAKTTYNMGMIAKSMRDPDLARNYFETALERFRGSIGEESPEGADCLLQLGYVAEAVDDHVAAKKHYGRALEIRRALGPDDLTTADILYRSMVTAFELEEWDQAIVFGEQSAPMYEDLVGPDHLVTLASVYYLARSKVRAGRFAEAEEGALVFHDRSLETYGESHENIRLGRELLVELYEGWGRPDEAATWR